MPDLRDDDGGKMRRLLSGAGTLFGIIWALPLTLLGLALALPVLLCRGRAHLVSASTPALVASGPVADFLLEHHPFGPMSAMAIGHVVLAERRGLTPRILTHELAHVRQAAQWGFMFPLAYLLASGWEALHGRDAYWHNVFEVAARKAEKHG